MPRVTYLSRYSSEEAKALAKELRDEYGEMLTVKDVTVFLGMKDRRSAARFLEGVPRYNINNKKYYSAADIATRLVESKIS